MVDKHNDNFLFEEAVNLFKVGVEMKTVWVLFMLRKPTDYYQRLKVEILELGKMVRIYSTDFNTDA
jgi:hypothetical protein